MPSSDEPVMDVSEVNPKYNDQMKSFITQFANPEYGFQIVRDAQSIVRDYQDKPLDLADSRVDLFSKLYNALAPSGTADTSGRVQNNPPAIINQEYQSLQPDPELFGI